MSLPEPVLSTATRRRRWSWRIRLILILLVGVPLAIGVATFVFVRIAEQRYQDAVAEADRLEPDGWRLDDLERRRAVVPDEENAGLQVLAVKQLLPAAWPAPQLVHELAEVPPEQPLEESLYRLFETELGKVQPALAQARRLAHFTRGRYTVSWSRDLIGTLIPHAQDTRDVANLLAHDASLRTQRGDIPGALLSCRATLGAARSLGDEPIFISQLVRNACRIVAFRQIERALAQGEAGKEVLAALQKDLEREADEPLLIWALTGERAMLDGMMQAMQEGHAPLPIVLGMVGRPGSSNSRTLGDQFEIASISFPGVIKNHRAALLHYTNRMVEAARLPSHEQTGAMDALEATAPSQPLLVREIMAGTGKLRLVMLQGQALLRCAAAALAAERFRLRHGRWPGTLDELVPSYLDQVPIDPFSGESLRVQRTKDGLTIYSVGPDLGDQAGQLHRQMRPPDGTDVGMQLWDPLSRRRSAVPPEAVSERDRMPP